MQPSGKTSRLASLMTVSALCLTWSLGACRAPDLSLTRSTPAPVLTAPLRQAREAIPASGQVTVRENDTIYDVAARYGVPPLRIVRENNIGPPYVISAGQVLVITPMRTHVVAIGDTSASISWHRPMA